LAILDRYGVSHAHFSAAQIEQMAAETDLVARDAQLALRAVAIDGASERNEAMYQWCERNLGLAPNIVVGAAEVPLFIGNSQHKWPAVPGSIGRPYPGHLVT